MTTILSASGFEFVLKPGELLYIPPLWLHGF
jgi:ribosomal protein L16 Arg81 hydroxylase